MVPCIPKGATEKFEAPVIIDIAEKEMNMMLHDSNPSNKRIEGKPKAERTMATKGIAVIDMPLAINHNNLVDLPEGGNGDMVICLGDIQLPEDEWLAGKLTTQLTKKGTEEGHAIEDSTFDHIRVYHGIKRVGSGTEVIDESKFFRVGFGNNVNRHGVHAWEEISTESWGVVI